MIVGPYTVGRELGRGSTSLVHEVTHAASGRRFAMKRPKHVDADSSTRLRREARVLTMLDHPNVVRVVDFVADGPGGPYLVMELLTGELLSDRIERAGRVALFEAAAIVQQVVSAVGTAHALGILHRDLKLENVLVTQEGVVKVLDFGVAKLGALSGPAQATSQLTQRGTALGTPYAMAPEQAFGEDVDHRSDIWSIGVVLYRILSGRSPVAGQDLLQIMRVLETGAIAPLRAVVPDVPADVAQLVTSALQRQPRDRPASLQRFRGVLERYTSVLTPNFDEPAAMERPSLA
ncbi:MAG: serine/threonine-protein kinase [Polyangiaceae bacterium]